MTFEEAKQRVQLAIATLEKRGHGGLTLDELKGVYGAMEGLGVAPTEPWPEMPVNVVTDDADLDALKDLELKS